MHERAMMQLSVALDHMCNLCLSPIAMLVNLLNKGRLYVAYMVTGDTKVVDYRFRGNPKDIFH